ncbi:nuclear transport factor 2 family protein [Sphingobium sp. WCS2017Hpa-17]|uniref:nuclear transport factor 2 family protein n=1 Tax=Sphingobium sp. WCS2017Hpa-17 TaxID=3073638 RepID=UPI00288B423E|nr:nuclear transport factor 2 family protein [Sphingobium sp. WCS2017Hpa-17]
MSVFEDRVAINDVLARYADCVNRRDAALWASTWDEEGEWRLFDPVPVKGRAAIVEAWQQAMAGFPFVVMIVSQGEVVINGDAAAGRSYSSEVARTADGKRMRVQGCYDDRYRKRNGVWGFAFRAFTVLDSENY